MNFGLRNQLKGVTLAETPNRLPGSPEMIAAQIAEVERDIAEWSRSIAEIQKAIRVLRDTITTEQTDIAYGEGKLRLLKAQLAEADRRKQNVPVPFPARRMVDSIVRRTE